jgi:hypothetical protein
MRELKYIVGCVLRMRKPFTSLSMPTMREALKSFAERFIEGDYYEKDILKLRLFDTCRDGYNQNVLTQPYMRIALIEDGMCLEDPRGPEYTYEYLSVSPKDISALRSLERDGWKYMGKDGMLNRYCKETKRT